MLSVARGAPVVVLIALQLSLIPLSSIRQLPFLFSSAESVLARPFFGGWRNQHSKSKMDCFVKEVTPCNNMHYNGTRSTYLDFF
jgi:hypothetical protein